ncbi:MAG: drug/metabolite exporter YedA [Chloroflexi bacterium]|nr:drug/metabolite exporter YedA [Chloroflexota bacterium]
MKTRLSSAAVRWDLVAAFAAVYLIWGSTYLGIRFAIDTIPPFLMAGSRFLMAGAILYAWMRRTGAARPALHFWKTMTIVGALLLVGGNGGVTWAEQYVPSSIAALVIGATPLWITLLDWLVFRGPRPTWRIVAGLATGLAGIALLVGPAEIARGEGIKLAGVAALMLASISWALGSLYSRTARLPDVPALATGMEMLAGGALLVLLGTLTGEWSELDLGAISAKSAIALIYLTLFGSLIGFSAYIWLLRNTSAANAATYAYVNPVVALFLGWALAGESITPRTLVAAAIIIGSVVLITSHRAQAATAAPEPESSPCDDSLAEPVTGR